MSSGAPTSVRMSGLVDLAVDPMDRLASDAGGSGLGGWRRVLRTNRNWSGVGRGGGDAGPRVGYGEVLGVEAVHFVPDLVWGLVWSGMVALDRGRLEIYGALV